VNYQTNNPAFTTFGQDLDYAGGRTTTMTVQGTALKALVLLMIVMATATFAWTQTEANPAMTPALLGVGFIGGLIFFFVTVFKKNAAPITAPLYSAFEGLLLGVISRYAALQFDGPNSQYGGIVVQAVALTGGVTFLMLFFYVTGIIKVTGQLATGIMAATGAIALLYVVSLVMSLFGTSIPFINGSSPLAIGFSVFVVGLAAFNLLLDFDFIDRGAQAGLSKSMEWYGAFGLMVTLIWLYLEVLRLLQKLNRR
jgi:uncharacterized YccA/Bax inhibitor family protein